MTSLSNSPSAYIWHAAPGIPPTANRRRSMDAYADHKRFIREFVSGDARCRATECATPSEASRLTEKLRQAANFLAVGDRVRVALRGKEVYVEKVS